MEASEIHLILDLTLEHADITTLLDCLFLSKHVHGVVMGLLKQQFGFLSELSRMFGGDIYQGIKFMEDCDDEYLENFENYEEILEFLRKNVGKYDTDVLFKIYVRLYPFNVNTKADYICCTVWEDETHQFAADFAPLIDKYYHKLTPNMIGILVDTAVLLGEYAYVIKSILAKGFNPVTIIRMPGYSYKTTILNYAISKKIYWLVQEIFDNKPDVFLCDRRGDCAYTLLKPYRTKGKEYEKTYNGEMARLMYTFEELFTEQKMKSV